MSAVKQQAQPRLVSLVAPVVAPVVVKWRTEPAPVAVAPRRRWVQGLALVVFAAWVAAMVGALAWGWPVIVPMVSGAAVLIGWGILGDLRRQRR